MLESFIFRLLVLAGLITFLAVRYWRRYKTDQAKERLREPQFVPTAFDGSQIVSRIERVRRDYLAVQHFRSRPTGHALRLLSAARQVIANLGYFRMKTNGQQ